MNSKFCGILILLGFAWNGLLGISGGVILHLHEVGHEHHSEHGDAHDCDIESKDDCCYESAHLILEAEELSALRVSDAALTKAPIVCIIPFGSAYDCAVDLSASQSSQNKCHFERSPPVSAMGSIVSKTVVLRV